MKVRTVRAVVDPDTLERVWEGTVVDLPADKARVWIGNGWAEAAGRQRKTVEKAGRRVETATVEGGEKRG